MTPDILKIQLCCRNFFDFYEILKKSFKNCKKNETELQ